MSEATPPSGETAATPLKVDPETLVLRAPPRPAVRFRRGLIIGVTGLVSACVVAVTWLALEPPSFGLAAGEERGAAVRGGAPDALANVPATYGDVPRLGPPLPGDLGRPILEHQRELEGLRQTPPDPGIAEAERVRETAEAERTRRSAARESARMSGLLVQLAGTHGAGASAPPQRSTGTIEAGVEEVRSAQAAARQVAGSEGRRSGETIAQALQAPPSAWMLSAGTILPASLITGLNSDLPGLVVAQVTQNVRDSATGRSVLVPQGARLIGSYDAKVSFGQRRALIAWQSIVFPDGSSVELDNAPATDLAGYAGVEDRVNFHTWRLMKGIALSSLLGVGTELSLGGGESELVRAVREATQQNAAQAGDKITARNLDVQPTLTVRPGWPVRAILHKNLVLRPWGA